MKPILLIVMVLCITPSTYTSPIGTQRSGHVIPYRFDYGPSILIRSELERDVFIPCPYSSPSLPTWIINGVHYESLQVPEEYISSPFGLLIKSVTVQLNETTFQCLSPTGHNYRLQESSVGKLIVYNLKN